MTLVWLEHASLIAEKKSVWFLLKIWSYTMNITISEIFKFSTLFQSIQAHKKTWGEKETVASLDWNKWEAELGCRSLVESANVWDVGTRTYSWNIILLHLYGTSYDYIVSRVLIEHYWLVFECCIWCLACLTFFGVFSLQMVRTKGDGGAARTVASKVLSCASFDF